MNKCFGINDYGVIIFEDEISDKYREEDGTVDYCNFEANNLTSYSGFSGSIWNLKTEAQLELDWNTFVFGSVKHFPSFYEVVYKDYSEIEKELKEEFGDLVKDTFPWENRIVQITGAIYG